MAKKSAAARREQTKAATAAKVARRALAAQLVRMRFAGFG
jgi:hypothetical protein